ncbi:MAG: hypothetical protein BZY81_05705 [SAR202 cluster bacterium Io17-Chloro-G4]|nr:MAG: hypothetical protein BZY81_05705 [SAR202 cluster bacterium Io17-Chloro-G4]
MSEAKNIILVGFMGSGKSVVGRVLARLTGSSMVDADAELVRKAGRPISQIFQEDGEPAFRELERSVIRDLCSQSGKVIAAGGGSFVDQDNRNLMLANGQVVCLSARPETILQRISRSQGNEKQVGNAPVRPLLAGDDPLRRIKELLAQRAESYAQADYTVETDELTPEQVADKVLELCRAAEKVPEI